MKHTSGIAFALYCILSLFSLHAQTNNTIPSFDLQKEIVFGQTGMLTGHFKQYTHLIQSGIRAHFEQLNKQGGIKGKLLRLISLDDEGRPDKAEKNIQDLLNVGIDMFLGNMGTRSILQTLPLVKSQKIALFFPWGGDAQLRDPSLTNIINGPGYLEPQIKKLAEFVTVNLGISKIAIFHADDSFSTEAEQAMVKELNTRNVQPVSVAEYNRQTLDIVTPAKKLMLYDPKAVICIGTSIPTVKLVNQFFEQGHFGTTFLGIDSTFNASQALRERGAQFYFSSFVPDPLTDNVQLAQEFRNALALIDPEQTPTILSFAYYISAKILTKAIQRIDSLVTKESILKEIEAMNNIDLGGFVVSFDSSNRHIFGSSISIVKGLA